MPDHWHGVMTVEACKAGKVVYFEKPVCACIGEAPKMIEVARKYGRVVPVGTLSRSAGHMDGVRKLVQGGDLGVVTSVRVTNIKLEPAEGIGNPPDSDPPPGLDWDMWIGVCQSIQNRPPLARRCWMRRQTIPPHLNLTIDSRTDS
jgi:predicted dehydrogenase